MGVFLRGKCRGCEKPFFTSRSSCSHCGAAPLQGIYWYEFRFAGIRISESSRSTDPDVARAEETKRREKVRREVFGILRPGASGSGPVLTPLFEEYAEQFLAWSRTVHRPATQKMHFHHLNTLKRYFSGRRLNEITRTMVEEFKQRRAQETARNLNRPVSGTTVNRALTTLSLLYGRATKQELYDGRNPAQGLDYFPEPKRQRILTFEEQARYLKHAGETMRDIMVLMTEMGFRPQDLLELEVQNVDLKQQLLHLWPLPAAGADPRDGKTPAARRSIPITRDMQPILEKRLERARQLQTRWLFPSPRNPDRHITTLDKAHRMALSAAGIIDRVRIYDFRHTGLTRLHEAGVQDLTLMRLAGHTSLNMTARYIKISDQTKHEAVSRLEAYKRKKSA